MSLDTNSTSNVPESNVAPLCVVTVVGWLPAVSSVPITPAAVPFVNLNPYVVDAVSAPTFDTTIVSDEFAPAPCVHVAVRAEPLFGSTASISQFVDVRSTIDDDSPVTVSAPAVLHQLVSSASGNCIVTVPLVGIVWVGESAIKYSTVAELPLIFVCILERKKYTALRLSAFAVNFGSISERRKVVATTNSPALRSVFISKY